MSQLLKTCCIVPALTFSPMLTAADQAPVAPKDQPSLRLTDLSAIVSAALGGSGGDSEEIEFSQSGAHDPRRDGFDFLQLELSIAGVVDPYFRAESHLIITEDEGLELEEAFIQTTSLPHGLEVEVGLMLTEFGRINPQHPHVWEHIDQPLVVGAMFGSEGTRDIGARLGWLLPTDWFSELHVTLQNGDNDTAVSFLGEGHNHGEEEEHSDEEEGEEEGHSHGGGSREIDGLDDMLWALRWVNGFELGEDAELQLGVSAARGPNLLEEHSLLFGADAVFKWYNPAAEGGAGTLSWTTEFIARNMDAHEEDESTDDWGLVSTVSYDLTKQWRVGFRLDYVDLEEHEDEHDDEEEGEEGEEHEHEEEHAPSELIRFSPLVSYRASEFANFRLQYNYTDPDEGDAVHSVWLGIEVLIGTHPAHDF